jgi:plastocyanin
MPRKPLLVLAVLTAVALTVAGAALSRSTSTPTLKGVVGPGYSIKLTKGGKRVKSLKAGKYRFVISDKSSFHNFTVEREKPTKPKLEKHITSTAFTGSKTIVMTLKPGSWSFYCSIHEAQMHGDFKVTR